MTLIRFCRYVKAKSAGLSTNRHLICNDEDYKLATWSLLKSAQEDRLISSRGARGVQLVPQDWKRLKPVMVEGVWCLGGRVQDGGPSKPILTHASRAAVLYVRHVHELASHAGTTHTLAEVRRTGDATLAKSTLASCSECRRWLAPPCGQAMAPLPSCRTEVGRRPFEECGLDYFGPFYTKLGRGHQKKYGCLFTCMKIRVVHIEVTSELSTDAFLMALNRFIARR